MAADGSMYRRNPLRSVADYEIDYQKVDAGNQTLQANALAMQEKQRANAESNALREAMRNGLDLRSPQGQTQALQIALNAAGPVIKSLGDAAHVAAQTDTQRAHAGLYGQQAVNAGLDQRVKSIGMTAQAVGMAKTPSDAIQAILQGHKDGAFGGNENAATSLMKQAMEAFQTDAGRQKFLEELNQSVVDAPTKFRESQSNQRNAATVAGTAATTAANIAARATEGAKDRANRVMIAGMPARTGSGEGGGGTKPPAGYRWTAGGALEPIPGGPADKPAKDDKALTQDQGKATAWLDRMNQTEQVILNASPESLTSLGSKSALAGAAIEAIPYVGKSGVGQAARNAVETPERQAVRNAQEVWVQGLLRSDTGAAYKDMEKADIVRAFFPQPNEGENMIAQKAALREGVRRSMQVRAGPGPKQMDKIPKAESGPVAIKTDADYAALKPGTRFVTPDGKTGTKR
tara:strand:- start:1537 stop:2919 length:1383 start_codon:yes stop_codon:yes gene_type:complete